MPGICLESGRLLQGGEEEPVIHVGEQFQASVWVVCFLTRRLGLMLGLSMSTKQNIVGKVEQGRVRLYF